MLFLNRSAAMSAPANKTASAFIAALAFAALPMSASLHAADKGDSARDSSKAQASGPSMQMHHSMMKGMKVYAH
jgi:hypothetical protein